MSDDDYWQGDQISFENRPVHVPPHFFKGFDPVFARPTALEAAKRWHDLTMMWWPDRFRIRRSNELRANPFVIPLYDGDEA